MRLLRPTVVVVFMVVALTGCGSSQHLHGSARGGGLTTGSGPTTTNAGRPSFEQRRGRPRRGPVGPIASGKGALLARVERAYRHVPGVRLTATAGARQFLLALHDGSVSAEEFIDHGPHAFRLVAREKSPTFIRAAGTACWRPLPDSTKRSILASLNTPAGSLRRLENSNPRTLLNVGYWFPDEGKAFPLRNKAGLRELEIETHDAFWYLAGTSNPSHLAPKSFLTIAPDPRSHRIAAIQVRAPERAVHTTLGVEALTARPTIPRPTPTC